MTDQNTDTSSPKEINQSSGVNTQVEATTQPSPNINKPFIATKQFMMEKMAWLKTTRSKVLGDGLVGLILPLFAIAVLVATAVTGIFAYQLGVQKGQSMSMVVLDESGKEITATEMKSIALENSILKSEVETLIKERDISLNNLNLVRDEINNLKINNGELKILADNLSETLNQQSQINGKTAEVVEMKVREFGISDKGEVIYEYRFSVLVPSMSERQIKPELTLLNSTSQVTVPMKPSSYKAKGVVDIGGKFAMPEEFLPSQLRFDITVDGEKISKLYNWQVD